jgi:nucleoside-diphosphate-sugar epimerase
MTRVPSIERARRILAWEPTVGIDEAIQRTVEFYLTKRPTRP